MMEMSIHKINNLFSEEELESLFKLLDSMTGLNIHPELGRIQLGFSAQEIPKAVIDKVAETVNSVSDKPLIMDHVIYVEYSNKYGESNLPPHVDGDKNNIVVDYQLTSNVAWDLGINTETYPLEDNSALIFNANTNVHWRPYKIFQDGEYVRMLFFRFYDPLNRPDYSYLPHHSSHDMFKPAHKVRDSLRDLSYPQV